MSKAFAAFFSTRKAEMSFRIKKKLTADHTAPVRNPADVIITGLMLSHFFPAFPARMMNFMILTASKTEAAAPANTSAGVTDRGKPKVSLKNSPRTYPPKTPAPSATGRKEIPPMTVIYL
jgi:hypothetical protein